MKRREEGGRREPALILVMGCGEGRPLRFAKRDPEIFLPSYKAHPPPPRWMRGLVWGGEEGRSTLTAQISDIPQTFVLLKLVEIRQACPT
jgi:hypothetical protein